MNNGNNQQPRKCDSQQHNMAVLPWERPGAMGRCLGVPSNKLTFQGASTKAKSCLRNHPTMSSNRHVQETLSFSQAMAQKNEAKRRKCCHKCKAKVLLPKKQARHRIAVVDEHPEAFHRGAVPHATVHGAGAAMGQGWWTRAGGCPERLWGRIPHQH